MNMCQGVLAYKTVLQAHSGFDSVLGLGAAVGDRHPHICLPYMCSTEPSTPTCLSLRLGDTYHVGTLLLGYICVR